MIWVGFALALANPAWADEPPASVSGRVSDVLGRPVAGANVHAVSPAGASRVVKTDHDGRYRIEIGGGGAYSIVFAHGGATAQKNVTVEPGAAAIADGELELGDGEIISIRALRPPPVLPKPLQDPRLLPKYSDAAILADAWTKAWVLLDVSPTGEVTRLKLLNPPGYDLEEIAIQHAFSRTFEPARDADNRPARMMLVWAIEWPSKDWLISIGSPLRAPHYYAHIFDRTMPAITKVACPGNGPWAFNRNGSRYRDCSRPNLDLLDSLPWIDRPAP